jgi:hypothetical protein
VTWWGWVLVWLVLLVGAGAVFFLLGRSLWRQATALFAELEVANERVGAVMEQVDALGGAAERHRELAVFEDPVALRRRREAEARRRAREREKRRRALLQTRRT